MTEGDHTKQQSPAQDSCPLLQNDLVAASPIFEECSQFSPLATPRQSFRLRPRERTCVADCSPKDVKTLADVGMLEPVKSSTLVAPQASLSFLSCLWRHLSVSAGRCVWTVEKQIGAWTDGVIDWLTLAAEHQELA